MDNLWTKEELVQAITGTWRGTFPNIFYNIAIDSRKVQKDDIFFALKGENYDGHDFIVQAVEAGASLLVVSKDFFSHMPTSVQNIGMLVVEDTLLALWQLAQAGRERSNATIIALTGSVGKTSAKNFLTSVLQNYGKVHAAPASFNNHIGVPLTLALMPRQVDFGIFELGMNAPNEISALTQMVRPHIAIITKVAPAHLQAFDSVRAIAAAKAEIFDYMAVDGIALLNGDDESFDFLKQQAQKQNVKTIYSLGFKIGLDYQIQPKGLKSFDFVYSKERKINIDLKMLGQHMMYNAAISLVVTHILQKDLNKAAQYLAEVNNVEGRGNVLNLSLDQKMITVIDETYNANPTSMHAALAYLEQMSLPNNGRHVVVLGDMLELGEQTRYYHEELASVLTNTDVDLIFLIGKNMQFLYQKLLELNQINTVYSQDCDELFQQIVKNLQPYDIVMLKASHSIGLGKIVELLKQNYGYIV